MKKTLQIAGTVLVVAGAACGGIVMFAKSPGGSASVGGASGTSGALTCRMQFRERVVTGAYKAYSLKDGTIGLWLAKSVFKNEGAGAVKDLRVRYKLGEYADWSSWQSHPELVPSQTVVDLYQPILSSKCAQLSSQTPAELLMEYEYVDARGNKQQKQLSERLTMLGRREFFFSDLKQGEQTGSFQDQVRYAPLLAAWVTAADMPVAGLASMANKRAGGVGASASVAECSAAMRQCYEIMRDIGITYQHPAGRMAEDKSFDHLLLQSIQYPRDTIEKRSGTCIDLAILYASMIESIGLESVLVTLDGHCFPMVVNPQGDGYFPVEATYVGGPGNSKDFAAANKRGLEEWNELQQTGRFVLCRPRVSWAAGIAQPELDALPADILERWGIRGQLERANQIVVVQPDNPVRAAAPVMAPGQWRVQLVQASGLINQGTATVTVQGQQVQLVYVGQYQSPGYDGVSHQFREQNTFVGTLNGQNLTATCQQSVVTLDGQNMPAQGLPMTMNLVLGANGRTAQGTVANAVGGRVQMTMEAL